MISRTSISVSGLKMTDVAVIAVLMCLYYLSKVTVLSGDSMLAWPITDSIMHPDRYSPDDFIVTAGVAGNFLLYRLLAAVPFLRDNLPLRDFLFYIPLFFLYLVAWWSVFVELGASRLVATVSLAIMLFSDFKLGLNWSISPLPNLISASSVQFLQVFALYFFISGRRGVALILTGLTGYFHPATALSFGAVYSLVIFRDFVRTRKSAVLLPVAAFALIYLPNAILIALNSQGAFRITPAYTAIFKLFQFHAFLEDHFRMGYAYTLVLICFLYWYTRKNPDDLRHREELFLFVGAGLLGSVLWLINLYFIHNIQVTLVYFIMRIFYLIKPLTIVLTVMVAKSVCSSSRPLMEKSVMFLLLLTPMLFSPSVALIIVAGAVCCLAGLRWWPLVPGCLLFLHVIMLMKVYSSPLQGVIPFLKTDMGGNELNLFQAIVMLFCVLVMFFRSASSGHEAVSYNMGLSGNLFLVLPIILVLLFSTVPVKAASSVNKVLGGDWTKGFDRSTYWGLRDKDPAYAELIDWVRMQRGSMFAVPPYDNRFMSFRYLTGKGVYAHQSDINQLAYSPDYYYSGYERLLKLGLYTGSYPKYKWQWGYEYFCDRIMGNVAVDYIVFEKRNLSHDTCGTSPAAYENSEFVVYEKKRDAVK